MYTFCFRPPPHSTPACPNQCRSTYCNACYYSENPLKTPEKCEKKVCKNEVKPACHKRWAKCVDKINRRKNKVPYQLLLRFKYHHITFHL